MMPDFKKLRAMPHWAIIALLLAGILGLQLALPVEFLRLAKVVGGGSEGRARKRHGEQGKGNGKAQETEEHRVIIC